MPIVDEHHAVAHEALVLDRHALADEAVARDLAALTDRRPTLDLDERADLGAVPDRTAVRVDEAEDPDALSKADIGREANVVSGIVLGVALGMSHISVRSCAGGGYGEPPSSEREARLTHRLRHRLGVGVRELREHRQRDFLGCRPLRMWQRSGTKTEQSIRGLAVNRR